MKLDLGKVLFLILLLTLSAMAAMAGNIKGTVLDKQTKEPLTGATVQIEGTTLGVVAGLDGDYTLEVKDGTYTVVVKYIEMCIRDRWYCVPTCSMSSWMPIICIR